MLRVLVPFDCGQFLLSGLDAVVHIAHRGRNAFMPQDAFYNKRVVCLLCQYCGARVPCRMESKVLRHIGELEYRLQFGSDTSAEWKLTIGANSKPNYTVKYKPRTLAEPSLARTATGTYTLTHSFGANHALLASGAASSTGSTLYMSVYSVASGTDKFVTSDDDTKNDFYCLWLFVFKFD